MTLLAKGRSARFGPPLRRGLPLVVLWTMAGLYGALALGLCLVPVGAGMRNGAGAIVGNDFLTFYAASILVHLGDAVAVFDPPRFFALQEAISGSSQHFPWAYPPIFLLFVAPLAHLPYLPALAVWVGASGLAFGLLVRRLSGLALPLVLIAPPLIQNAADGQNGAWTGALFAGAILALANRRALLAGVLLGLLAYKPQVFILAPICLLAAREYRALAMLVVTSLALVLLSLGFFGVDIWWKFLAHLPDHAATLLGDRVQSNRVPTIFAAIDKLTHSRAAANLAQALATLGAGGLVFWVWRGCAAPFARALAVCVAMPLATPILLEYDLTLWTLPMAMLAARLWREGSDWRDWTALMLLAFLPSLIWITASSGFDPWAALILALVPYVIFAARRAGGALSQPA
jgi:alpha-1,2-mannosyltransferase